MGREREDTVEVEPGGLGTRASADPARDDHATGRDPESSGTTPDAPRDRPEPGADEVFCVECGEVIERRAEICTHCGVRQRVETPPVGDRRSPPRRSRDDAPGLDERRRRELEAVADSDEAAVALVGFLLSPVAYLMVDKPLLAAVNLLTFNYLFLGPLLVPVHCHAMIRDAEATLARVDAATPADPTDPARPGTGGHR